MALVFRRPAQSVGRPAQKRSAPSLAYPAKRECRAPGQAAGGVHKYEFWPSDLKRAGHTSVEVEDHEPLGRHLAKLGPNEAYGIHLARMQKLPCKLIPSSKFRNGADRWWCPIHQGSYGKKAQLEQARKTGVKCCDQSAALVDCVCSSEVKNLRLVEPGELCHADDYCELGLWIGLAPALDTYSGQDSYFFAGIHVHARKELGGTKVIDKNYPAVRIKDATGRFPNIPAEGILVTTPAALEYLYYMENRCPVNAQFKLAPSLPRSTVQLKDIVRCKYCSALHEDIGDRFGQQSHKKHLCGSCGRDICDRAGSIGNPLQVFDRVWSRKIVDQIDPQNKEIRIDSAVHRLMCWPSTPALFWSRGAPEVWQIHVHGYDERGDRVIDDTYGSVYLDGKKLSRAELFLSMLRNSCWMEDKPGMAPMARELEDD